MGQANLSDRWTFAFEHPVKYFNGSLFAESKVYELAKAERGELLAAAKHEWKNVEPAIFGTLLEQALTPSQRSRLGAHYTPRPYVERIVEATITDVLRTEWEQFEASLEDQSADERLQRLRAFHDRLANIVVLDPACGTGNFLYVAMEALLGIENKVIQAIEDVGGEVRSRIGPAQFHGLEKNPRAAKIAELVLWIGWLRWNIRNGAGAIEEPILAQKANINFGRHGGYDAILAQDDAGQPILHEPRPADWPEADFIVGNPPFIGGKDIRSELGDDYAEAVWKANPNVGASSDFVMQWWDRAAETLGKPKTRLKRFGFVTTNSITQTFSRRVIEQHLAECHLVLACPDHPWTKATRDAAAVRIAMTVSEAGAGEGRLLEVEHEAKLDSDEPELAFSESTDIINANLTVGTDPSRTTPLLANEGLSSRGVALHGSGFIVTPGEAQALGLGRREGLERHIRPYRNGRDLLQRSRNAMVIDLFGLSEEEVRQRFPEVYQHLLRTRATAARSFASELGPFDPAAGVPCRRLARPNRCCYVIFRVRPTRRFFIRQTEAGGHVLSCKFLARSSRITSPSFDNSLPISMICLRSAGPAAVTTLNPATSNGLARLRPLAAPPAGSRALFDTSSRSSCWGHDDMWPAPFCFADVSLVFGRSKLRPTPLEPRQCEGPLPSPFVGKVGPSFRRAAKPTIRRHSNMADYDTDRTRDRSDYGRDDDRSNWRSPDRNRWEGSGSYPGRGWSQDRWSQDRGYDRGYDRNYDRDRNRGQWRYDQDDWSGYENRNMGYGRFGQDIRDRDHDRDRHRGHRDHDHRDRYDYRSRSHPAERGYYDESGMGGGYGSGRFDRDRQDRMSSDRYQGQSRGSQGGQGQDGFLVIEEYDFIIPGNQHDHYRNHRNQHMSDMDRDYQDYCRERQQKFDQDFGEWRRNRQNQSGQSGDIDQSDRTRRTGGSTNEYGAQSSPGKATTGTSGSKTTTGTKDSDRTKELESSSSGSSKGSKS